MGIWGSDYSRSFGRAMGMLIALLTVMVLFFVLLVFGLCLYPLSERDMDGY